MPDVDIEASGQEALRGAFNNSGQVCVAAKRLYVHESIYDPLREALADSPKAVKVGDGLEQGTQLGPIQNKMQFDKLKGLFADSHAKGHKFLRAARSPRARATTCRSTIVDNPPEDSRVVVEEPSARCCRCCASPTWMT